MHRCVLHWGEMAGRWGVSRSVAQIHALLFLAPTPLPADEIADTLNVARSNVSVSLKELQAWDLVSVTHQLGDRRDYFQALQMLRECSADARKDHETPEQVKQRIGDMLEFLEEVSGWYDQIRAMPRPTLLKLMRMGTKVAKIVT
jgi:DNA-binding transcriptional regulator GbsR (MarR family)